MKEDFIDLQSDLLQCKGIPVNLALGLIVAAGVVEEKREVCQAIVNAAVEARLPLVQNALQVNGMLDQLIKEHLLIKLNASYF